MRTVCPFVLHPSLLRLCAVPVALLATSPALAHPGHNGGLLAGVAHPFTGADHLLAMFAVGLLSAARGGRAMIAWPAAFVAAAAAGFAIARLGVPLPLVEPGILASVIVLGLIGAGALRMPVAAGASLIALFGLMHGYAHGSEAGTAAPVAFAAGFLASTAVLHGAGILVGARLGALWLRIAGGATVVGGLALALA